MEQGQETVQKYRVVLLALGAIALLWPSVTGAEEIKDLKQELETQKQRTAELESRINQLEAQQKLKDQALTEKIGQATTPKVEEKKEGEIPDVLKWASRVKWSGDFRYRYEFIDDDNTTSDRHRNRIRARLGLEADVSDEWGLGFRLATSEGSSGGDPVSTNQTLDGSYSKKSFWLDLAYLNYRPNSVNGLSVTAGKMINPFYTPGKNQLIWDSDLTPEGGALGYTHALNDKTSMNLSAGGFWVNEESTGADTSLWGIQGYLKHQISKPTYALVGVSSYDYGNIEGKESLASEWKGSSDFFGNTSAPGNVFASDYDLFDLFAEFGTVVGKLPVAVFGDWVKNTVASTDRDTGWLIGASLNKIKDPGSWQFDYDYREIDADAVVGQFNDSDFVGGGTDGKGHRFSFTYQLTKNVASALTYFAAEYWGRKDNDNYDRVQADIMVKF